MIDQAVAQQPLEQRIQLALSTSPYVSGKRVLCRADRGQVTLSGQVSSYFQKQMAQETVRRFDGVEQIENLLVVNRGAAGQLAGRLS